MKQPYKRKKEAYSWIKEVVKTVSNSNLYHFTYGSVFKDKFKKYYLSKHSVSLLWSRWCWSFLNSVYIFEYKGVLQLISKRTTFHKKAVWLFLREEYKFYYIVVSHILSKCISFTIKAVCPFLLKGICFKIKM